MSPRRTAPPPQACAGSSSTPPPVPTCFAPTLLAGTLLLLLATWSAAGGPTVFTAQASGPAPSPHVEVLISTAERLVVEYTSPPLRLEPQTLGGTLYTAVAVDGLAATAEQGHPRLPVAALFFALPPGAPSAQRAGTQPMPLLQVLEDDVQILHLLHPPAPVARRQASAEAAALVETGALVAPPLPLYVPDPALYAPLRADADAIQPFYPAAAAAVGAPLNWRGGTIAPLRFYPLQVVPHTGEARYHRRLRVEIRFGAGESSLANEPNAREKHASSPAPAPDPAIDPTPANTAIGGPLEPLRQRLLLNAEAAGAWYAPPATLEAEVPTNSTANSAGSGPWLKVAIRHDGWYRINCTALAPALSSGGVDIMTLRLSTLRLLLASPAGSQNGAEVALRRVDGDGDDRCDDSDSIEFWGAARPNRYSELTVFWLLGGESPGLAIPTQQSTQGGVPLALAQCTVTLEADRLYRSSIPARGEEHDHWFWELLAGNSPVLPSARTYTLTLPAPAPAVAPDVAAAPAPLAGGTATGAQAFVTVTLAALDGDHRVHVTAGSTPVGELSWNGRGLFTGALPLPRGLPAAGDTLLRLELNPAAQGLVLVDRLQVSYWAAPTAPPAIGEGLSAAGGSVRLMMVPRGAWQLDFGEPLSLLDITDPLRPVAIATACPLIACAGKFGLRLDEPHAFAAVTAADVLAPAAVLPAAPPHLRAPTNGADYILIAHADLLAAAAPLAAQRRAQGLRVALVDVQDIYDEFGSGQDDAEAIRRFLAYAYAAWQPPAPAYVLLLGDGTFDPRGRCYPAGACPSLVTPLDSTFIPPYLADVDPWLGETAADSRLAAIGQGSILPFFAIGRLPANTPAEAQAMVAKLLAYENTPPEAPDAAKRKGLVFVADNAFASDGSPDPAGNFWQMSDVAAAVAVDAARAVGPVPPPVERFYLNLCDAQRFGHCALADPPYWPLSTGEAMASALGTALEKGSLLVHYSGHGSIAAWGGQPSIWGTGDVQELANAARLPLVVDMTCYTGYFHYPGLPSLAETWLAAPGGGAAAVVASSGLGLAEGHATLDASLLAHLFDPQTRTVGEALLAAKLAVAAAGGPPEDVDTFALFGDPAMPLHPLRPQLTPVPTADPTADPTAGLTASPTATPDAEGTPTPGLPLPTTSPSCTPTPFLTEVATPTAPTAPARTPTSPPAATPPGTLPLYLPHILRCGACSGALTPGMPAIPLTATR